MIIGICEDQEEVRMDIRRKIERNANSCVFEIYEFCSGEEMLSNAMHFDLVFLDIELAGALSGLEVAQQLQNKQPDTIVIFLSSYTKYVSSAFRLHTFQFLLKPLDENLFQEELRRCLEYYRLGHNSFRISIDGEVIDVAMKDVMYLESDKRKLRIHLRNGREYEMYGKISEQEKMLGVHHFVRIHKSYLINCRYVRKLEGEQVWLANSSKDELVSLPVSRRCKETVKKTYHLYLLGVNNK